MTSIAVQNSINQLLDVLTSCGDAVTVENGHIKYAGAAPEIIARLKELAITIDDDLLDYSNFIVPQVFPSADYEQRIEPASLEDNFLVINQDCSAVLYYESSFTNFGSVTLFKDVQNSVSYYRLYNYLKSPAFADHHNSADREIIIYSSGRGILKIRYESIAPRFDELVSTKITELLIALQDIQLKKYIQNSLFEFATGNVISETEIVLGTDKVLSAAKRDFELAVKQFDFEKFRDALYVQKDKFFAATRDVINKIYSQIIGIPISITASVFASYNTNHNALVSVIILVAFLLYVAIYLVIQRTYLTDITEIDTDFKRDFAIISTQSGLPPDIVATEYKKIETKISNARKITIVLMYSIVTLGVCVLFFILGQIIN